MESLYKQVLGVVLIVLSVPLQGGNSGINALILSANGTILTAGFANNFLNDASGFAFARYMPDGSLDQTFNPNGRDPGTLQFGTPDFLTQTESQTFDPPDEAITGVALDTQQRIVAAGFSSVGQIASIVVMRLNQDGSRDTTFNASGNLGIIPGIALIKIGDYADVATGVALDSQGRIVVVGSTDDGQELHLVVLRLTPDGKLDPTFNAQGGGTPGIFTYTLPEVDIAGSCVALNDDDTIVVGGTINTEISTDFILFKLTPAGVLDTSFNGQSLTPGIAALSFQQLDDEAFALQIDSQKRIVIGGFTSNGTVTSFALARFTKEGVLDTETFNPDGVEQGAPGTVITTISGHRDSIRGMALTEDDRIAVTGLTDDTINISFASARYEVDGSLDTTFNPQGTIPGIVVTTILPPSAQSQDDIGITADDEAFAAVLDAQSNLFVSGFSFDGYQTNFTTAKYSVAGILDPTFSTLNPNNLIINRLIIPGIVITPFGEELSAQGNGVTRYIYTSTVGVNPRLLSELIHKQEVKEPSISSDLSKVIEGRAVQLSGTAASKSFVTVYIDDVSAGSTSASKTGEWSITIPGLVGGIHEVTAVSLDLFSAGTLASLARSFKVLSDTPPVPEIISPTSFQRIDILTPAIAGKARPGDHIILSLDGTDLMSTDVAKDGSWKVMPTLFEGAHILTARAHNPHGKESLETAPVRFLIQPPAERAPQIVFPKSGFSTDKRVIISGKGTPGYSVHLMNGNTVLKTVPVSKEGAWSYTLPYKPGAYELTARSSKKDKVSEKVRITLEKSKPTEVAAVLNPQQYSTEASLKKFGS